MKIRRMGVFSIPEINGDAFKPKANKPQERRKE
jgi:hypothetical protein